VQTGLERLDTQRTRYTACELTKCHGQGVPPAASSSSRLHDVITVGHVNQIRLREVEEFMAVLMEGPFVYSDLFNNCSHGSWDTIQLLIRRGLAVPDHNGLIMAARTNKGSTGWPIKDRAKNFPALIKQSKIAAMLLANCEQASSSPWPLA